jgi:tRNA-binding protein
MTPAHVKPPISPDLLNQIDVRVGTILTVTDVANSEKLVALEVSFGDHRRTVLAGMKRERADPREIEGKQALFVVNLAPRKMAGMVSEGMLFDIGYADGITPVLATPEAHVRTERGRDNGYRCSTAQCTLIRRVTDAERSKAVYVKRGFRCSWLP